MPFVKISGLTTATAVSATNQFEINQNGASRSATIGQIETFINPAKAGAVGSSGLTMNTSRLLGRTTTSAGAVEEISVGAGLSLSGGTLASTATAPNGTLVNVQVFTSSGTYTRTSGVTRVIVVAVGGGGGGGGVGGAGGTGGTTSFGSHVTAIGGSGGGQNSGSNGIGGAGGTGGTGATIAIPGQGGASGYFGYQGLGGGQGGARSQTSGIGNIAGASGSRGGGGAGSKYDGGCGGSFGGGGGGQGETAIDYITSVGATETVTIGAGGTAGATGGIIGGGAGGAGYVIVYEYS